MRRRIVILLLIIVSFILQSTVFQSLSIGSIAPNLLLILTVSFGFMRGKKTGLWTGFVCGLMIDMFYGNLLGFYALVYMTAGYITGFCYKIYYDEDIKVPMILIAVCDIGFNLMVYCLQFLLRGRIDFFYYLRRIMIPEMVYTILITLVFYRILYKINHKLVELEMKERDSTWLRK